MMIYRGLRPPCRLLERFVSASNSFSLPAPTLVSCVPSPPSPLSHHLSQPNPLGGPALPPLFSSARLATTSSSTTTTEEENEEGTNVYGCSSSAYLSARIQCLKRDSDALSEALLCFGANSASMDELSDNQEDDEIWITSVFADGQDVHACILLAAQSIGLNYAPKCDVSVGEQCNWVKNAQEAFYPIEIIDGLWIVPKWRNPQDSQATNIILDPGMAFGTGEHPTTKLCLLMLHGILKGGEHFLDYGTGSGILGIAAVKMGAALSIGIDVDPQAVTAAHRNIALNDMDSNSMLVFLVPSGSGPYTDENGEQIALHRLKPSKEKFDIVIANILLNPLLKLAEDIVTYGKPGAKVGLSGILSEQVPQVKEAYSLYLDNISVSEMEGWACLHGDRKENITFRSQARIKEEGCVNPVESYEHGSTNGVV